MSALRDGKPHTAQQHVRGARLLWVGVSTPHSRHGLRPRPRRATPLTLSARGGQGAPAGRLVEASMTHTAQTSSG